MMLNKIKIFRNKIINSLIGFLTKLASTYESKGNTEYIYSDLTPRDDVDKDNNYSTAIKEALKNLKVKNVALTGNYGSGKSSILQTFQKKHKEYNYLNISLATFKKGGQPNGIAEENLLEKSILQQMFYTVNTKKIPHSRFKRITKVGFWKVLIKTCLLFLMLLLLLQIIKPGLLGELTVNFFALSIFPHHPKVNQYMNYILFVSFLCLLVGYTMQFYLYLSQNLSLSKIVLPKATIELSKKDDNSIFHKYIDEILYFFQVTDYDVVIFEDLDRFDNLEIFENLRELNTLINNSEQVNRRLVFIYAVKDEIFGSEDTLFHSKNRTKFFDFIIPVIPTINSSNSLELLKEKLKNSHGDGISNQFLNDITVFIDDMRVLTNICNEYIIHRRILGDINLNPDHLLAIIVYKNIYPVDFANLHSNNGMVYEVFEKKENLLHKSKNELEVKIQSLDNDISSLSQETLASIEELQSVYADALGLTRDASSYINLDGQQFNYNNWRGSFFEKLKEARSAGGHGRGNRVIISVEAVDTVHGTKQRYTEREIALKLRETKTLEGLKHEISLLKKKKEELNTLTLKELIDHYGEEPVLDESIKDKKLLIFLIRNGYIDELYPQYITYFYPGSISIQDMQFIMNVKNREGMNSSYQIGNKEKNH